MKKRIASVVMAAVVFFSNPMALYAADLPENAGTVEEMLPVQEEQPAQEEQTIQEEQTSQEMVSLQNRSIGDDRQGEQDGWEWALEDGVLTVSGTGRVSAGWYAQRTARWRLRRM